MNGAWEGEEEVVRRAGGAKVEAEVGVCLRVAVWVGVEVCETVS